MLVDDHVTAYLSGIEAIVPDLQQTDGLVGDDVEDEDIEGMVASIDQELLESVVVFIEPVAKVVGHQETQDGREGEREKLLEGGAPVHVGCKILREDEHDSGKKQGRPETGHVMRHQLSVGRHILFEDKTNAKEETAHHLAVAALYEVHYLQAFPCLPSTEKEHG